MKRSEQDIRFQWDLTKIYPDTAAWEAAMQEAEAALAPLAAIPGTLGTSKEAFKKGLDTIYASMFKVELPYTYAFLKKTEDGSVAENQEMAARSESLLVKFSAATAFLNPEILAIPAEKLDEWMQDEALATYRHTVDDIVRMRAHTLDAAREQMLALLGMLTPQAYSTASLDVRDIQDLLQALQWEPDKASAFWPDLCDACRTLYRLSGEQLDIYVRLTQPAYAADLRLVEPDTLPPS